MVKGASEGCRNPDGSYVQRQGLDEYEALGYMPFDIDVRRRNANSLFGDPNAVWASAATTLEYAIADFSIAQFAARALGDRATYRSFMSRSGNWRNLLNPRSGQIEPRFADGTFPPRYDNLRGAGFAEGNSMQYTWMVPHDPAGLFAAIGGRARAAGRLDRFLRKLNGGGGATHADHALLGNEPNLNVPWLYDWTGSLQDPGSGAAGAADLYGTSPEVSRQRRPRHALLLVRARRARPLPGGPGRRSVGDRQPPLPAGAVRLAGGRKLRILASAGADPPVPCSIHSGMRINGHAYGRPWTTVCALARGATLTYRLGAQPNRAWGGSAAALPPSFGTRRPMPEESLRSLTANAPIRPSSGRLPA